MSSSISFLAACPTGNVVAIGGCQLLLAVFDDRPDFRVGHERALDARGFRCAHRQEQAVALAEQLLRARLVEDYPRVSQRRGLEAQPGRHIGLDQTGDDVDRRPLGGDHEVDAGRPRELGDPDDGVLDVPRGDHHQIGQLVDDDEQVRIGRIHTLRPGRRTSFTGPHLAVEVVDVPDPGRFHVLVAHVHFANDPAQRVGRLLRVGDHRRDEVRNRLDRPRTPPAWGR